MKNIDRLNELLSKVETQLGMLDVEIEEFCEAAKIWTSDKNGKKLPLNGKIKMLEGLRCTYNKLNAEYKK